MAARRDLRVLLSANAQGGVCRSAGCASAATGRLGFCRCCEALYREGRRVRERLLVEHGARIAAAHPGLFSALRPSDRRLLLAHLAAHAGAVGGAGCTAVTPAGLEDFFRELAGWPAVAGEESAS